MDKKTAQSLLEFIAENLELDSPYMAHRLIARVEVSSLLDKIAELRGISPEENGEEFNQIMEKLDQLEQEEND